MKVLVVVMEVVPVVLFCPLPADQKKRGKVLITEVEKDLLQHFC